MKSASLIPLPNALVMSRKVIDPRDICGAQYYSVKLLLTNIPIQSKFLAFNHLCN